MDKGMIEYPGEKRKGRRKEQPAEGNSNVVLYRPL
jgi:hypothetical protein